MRKETKRLRRIAKLLRQRTAGPPCNPDGTFTVGNCPPDALCHEAASAIEKLIAELEVARAAAEAAISKAQWQAVTNRELNDLLEWNRRLRERKHQPETGKE